MATRTAMTIPRISFGDRLRRVRLTTGLTQDAFGATIGISGATVGKYELMDSDPKLARVIANSVELRYGIPAWWLLGRQPTGSRPRDDVIDLRDNVEIPIPRQRRRWLPPRTRLSRAAHELPSVSPDQATAHHLIGAA